jgi:glycine/D-amino acid oxidase-like deaminating enzyme
MAERADMVIVGAGIIGSSIAYQIARRSPRRVVVLEKGAGVAEGSTGASSSIVRCKYTHPEVVRLARHGQEAYRDWGGFTGLDAPRSRLEQPGVLWLMGDPTDKVEQDAERLGGQGVAVTVLDPGELTARFPDFSDCAVPFDLTGETPHTCAPGEAFLYEEEGGYADPAGANQDLVDAARREGADIRFGTMVTAVRRDGDRVTGVTTGSGETIDAPMVINAAGPWCNKLNDMAGVSLRWTLDPTRVQILYRELPVGMGPIPVTADGSTGIYFRPESRGQQILVGSVLAEDEEEVVDPDDYLRSADAVFRNTKIHGLHHRLPELPHRGGLSGIAGLYTINRQDVHPVLGPTELEGWWVANGFSGHGFKLAPMIGSMIAQAVTDAEASHDTDVPMSFFSVDREPIEVADKHVLA